jgi:hypothetical protein
VGSDELIVRGICKWIEERTLPLAPEREPVPFRGIIDGGEEAVTFVD